MKPRTIFVGLLFAIMFAYTVANNYLSQPFARMFAERGWGSSQRTPGGPNEIVAVVAGGAATELQKGDEIVALDGVNVERDDAKMENLFHRIERGAPYTLTVRRAGALRDFTLRANPIPMGAWLAHPAQWLHLLLGLCFFAVGLAVFVLRPDDKQALVFTVCFSLYAASWSLPFNYEGTPLWLMSLVGAGFVCKQFFAPLMLHLFLVFPKPLRALMRRPRLEFYAYLPFLLVSLPINTFLVALWVFAPADSVARLQNDRWMVQVSSFVQLAYAVACLGALGFQYREADQVAKRKLRLILVSCLLGFGPTIAVLFVSILLAKGSVLTLFRQRVWLVAACFQLLVPAGFAYAIVRHQVFPVKLIIRRGLQYLLAKNALRLALALPVVGLALSIISNRERRLSEILLGSSLYFYLFIAAAALALAFRRRLGNWVDHKFFRESYNQEKILRELTDDVKKLDSIPEMSKRVTERVTAALHPARAFLFYRAEGARDLSLTYTSGGGRDATQPELKIPEEFRLLRFMEDQGSAQEFPFPQKNNLPQSEKTWLASLGTRLIVPLTGTDERLAGLLLLGEKKSEVPYTAGDRELLETLAGQIAIVYENVQLKNRVDRDRRIKQQVLSRVAGQDMNVLKECPRCGACFDMAAHTCDRDGAELTLSLPVERTIETRYRLERLVGKGGMGAVYEATDLRLQRKVAVKILTGSMFGDSQALRRFEREAQASARLRHPNIVTIHDYGLLSTEGAYLVMELIAGETLGARLSRERRLAPADAAHVFDQILDGLKSAHAAGVVHRDLKPENVLLSTSETGQARVHLLDFGLAKLTQALPADSRSPTAPAPVTTPGAVMGTFGYMSPEQLTGGAVDERSDLFSIGVMVVEAVTGRRPFTGTTYHELLTNILNADYHLEDDSPAAQQLDAALQKSLAKDPAARYDTAAAMQRELIPALRQCPPLVAADAPAALDAETFILKN